VFVPGYDNIKVLKYDGTTWTNYTSNIPNDEIVYSMVMDYQTNDGIYLSTDKGVYYRTASNSTWSSYVTGLPRSYARKMEVNYAENTVRAGLFGRGIYKSDLYCTGVAPLTITGCNNCNSATNYFWEGTTIGINSTNLNTTKQIARATESITVTPGSTYTQFNSASISSNYYQLFIHGCDAT
jgi:hypothetical protein